MAGSSLLNVISAASLVHFAHQIGVQSLQLVNPFLHLQPAPIVRLGQQAFGFRAGHVFRAVDEP